LSKEEKLRISGFFAWLLFPKYLPINNRPKSPNEYTALVIYEGK